MQYSSSDFQISSLKKMAAYLSILLLAISLVSPALSSVEDVDITIPLQAVLLAAQKAEAQAYSLGPKALTPLQKKAWADCVELHGSTHFALNKTLQHYKKSSKKDKQTWLSSALTYLEACKDSLYEVGETAAIMPSMYPLGGSICKLLARNKASKEEDYFPKHKKGIPSWVKKGDRKLLQAPAPAANAVVQKGGKGTYQSISAAIAAASKRRGTGRFVIFIAAGVYNEYIEISTPNIMLVGAGKGRTIITGSRSVGGGSTTFGSATVAVTGKGSGFFLRALTIRNTAGPQNHQAVAFRSSSDQSVAYQCSFEGYQDTLYAFSNRQFYRECDIYGTVDFIFGNAAAVFQNCNIYPRNTPTHTNTLTAQSRTDPNQNTGFSFQNCYVTAAPDLRPVQKTVKTFLGRPWKAYSRVVYMGTYLDSLIHPNGWYFWIGNQFLTTLFYGEYFNTGPGSSTANRINWKGVHRSLTPAQANLFTVTNLIGGRSWLPATGVPFRATL